MKINELGVNLVKEHEGCCLKAYPDPATNGDPWTIGYGATGKGIKPGVEWTQAQADKRLLSDLNEAASQINKVLTVELTDNQFSALVSLVFNIGIGNFEKSTMLKLLNVGRGTNAAAMEFPKWDKAAGKEMPGLLKRRLAEQKLFNT